MTSPGGFLRRRRPADRDRAGRWPALDGVRALAALAVVVFHVSSNLAPGGGTGVDVFFTLSGFLITTLLLRERDRRGRVDLAGFYLRRATRLYPALIAAVILAALLTPRYGYGWPHLAEDAAEALTYTTDLFRTFAPHPSLLSHTWTLAVEEQFYFLWPVTLMWAVTHRDRRFPLYVALAVSVLSVATGWLWAQYEAPWTNADCLMVGCALAIARQLDGWPGRATRLLARPSVAWPSAGLLLAVVVFLPYQPIAGHSLVRGGYLVTSLASASVISCAIEPHSSLGRVLGLGPLRWVGQRSYGVYLYHFPVVAAVASYRLRPRESLPIDLAASMALAALSFALFERRITRWGRERSRAAEVTDPAAGPAGAAGPPA